VFASTASPDKEEQREQQAGAAGAGEEVVQPKGDLFKALALGFTLLVSAGALQHDWVGEHQVRARGALAEAVRDARVEWPPCVGLERTGRCTDATSLPFHPD